MYKIIDEFIPQKTSDIFKSVEFSYGNYTWYGVIPKKIDHQGLDRTDDEITSSLPYFYDCLTPSKKIDWISLSDKEWNQKTSETYKVLKALYSGNWECRVCGPVPKVNAQPAARIRDLKKKGYIIGSQTKRCNNCSKTQMHDILVMLPKISNQPTYELRKPMSEKLKKEIKKEFGHKEAASGRVLTTKELLIDHKFPSQRWSKPESENSLSMDTHEIKNKFQLLNNQSNTLKSRHCDSCLQTGKRGTFMDIKWYYQGNENWVGNIKDNEEGCKGCPWYDLELWKFKLQEKLK